jgi:hypothetical protein
MAGATQDEVLDHLLREVVQFTEERDLLLKERDGLIRQDLDCIQACLREKETLQAQARILDESRRILLGRLGDGENAGQDPASIWELAERAEEPVRSRLLVCRETLTALADHVEELTEGNAYLIRSALGHISRSIQFLGQIGGLGGLRYDDRGRLGCEAALPARVGEFA